MSLHKISENFDVFKKQTRDNFTFLKNFLQKEFITRINKLEEKIELSPAYLDELLNLKNCLLEVQQKFFDLKKTHRELFLKDLEQMILKLVQRVMHLETQIKHSTHSFRQQIQ